MKIYEGLDRTDALNCDAHFAGVEWESEPPPPSAPSPKTDEPSRIGKAGVGVTLPQLLELVERAAKGDKELGGQLFTAFQQMCAGE